jgi:hypothetical protein
MVHFWSKENPHVHKELEHKPPNVTWAAISGRHIFHPYFLAGSMNQQHISLTMLRDWVVTQLECMKLTSKVWIQQDRAPLHYVISV